MDELLKIENIKKPEFPFNNISTKLIFEWSLQYHISRDAIDFLIKNIFQKDDFNPKQVQTSKSASNTSHKLPSLVK